MFWRALHLEDLAIARGCALGASPHGSFLAQYREQLTTFGVTSAETFTEDFWLEQFPLCS
jgi:hypothetical protein